MTKILYLHLNLKTRTKDLMAETWDLEVSRAWVGRPLPWPPFAEGMCVEPGKSTEHSGVSPPTDVMVITSLPRYTRHLPPEAATRHLEMNFTRGSTRHCPTPRRSRSLPH